MRTSEAISPVIGPHIALSLLAFIVTYSFIFGAASYYIIRLIGKGPGAVEETYGTHGIEKPPLVTDLVSEIGGENV